MKKCFIGVVALLMMVITSCSKEDEADAFLGTYSVSTIDNVTWGGSSGTLTDNGTMTITKLSSNRVQLSGYISTFGEVVGKNLYLESTTSSSSSGSLTFVFGTGTLNGNVLIFSTTTTGRMIYNGVYYPYNSIAQHTCIRQ